MRNKICPKCGCIFDEEKLKCIDCAELLRQATANEIAVFERKTKKRLNRASDHSEGTCPEPWQYIAIAGLMGYSVIITFLFGLSIHLIALNAVFALGIIIPSFRIYSNFKKGAERRFWFKIYYPHFRYKIAFYGALILNCFILLGLIFRNV